MTNTDNAAYDDAQHGHGDCGGPHGPGSRGHNHGRGYRDFGAGAPFAAAFEAGRGFGPGTQFGSGMPFGPGFRRHGHGFRGFPHTPLKKSEIRIMKQLRRLVRTLIANRDTATKEQRQQLLALLENTTAEAKRILTGTKVDASATEE